MHLAKQNGFGGLLQRFDAQLADLRKQLGDLVGNLFSATGQIAVSAAGFVAALATVLTLTFFLLAYRRSRQEASGLAGQSSPPTTSEWG